MGGSWVEGQIEEYKESLTPADKEKFEKKYEAALSPISAEDIREELEAQVDQEEAHLDLITAAASAFHQHELAAGSESGFQFAFTEPLHELNSEEIDGEVGKTADLLLVKEEEEDEACLLCLVECKAGQARVGWVNELDEIGKCLENDGHRNRLLTQAGVSDLEVKDVQYVLLGKVNEVHSLSEDQLEDEVEGDLRHAFWGWARGEQTLVHIHGLVKDQDLRQTVRTPVDTGLVENPIRFTLGEHPLIILRSVIEDILRRNLGEDLQHPMEFTYQDFLNQLEAGVQLGAVGQERQNLIDSATDKIIDLGLKIGIFTESTSKLRSNKDYRIMFSGRKPDVAREEANRKFFKWMSEEKRKERAFEQVRDEFTPGQQTLF